MRVYEQLSELYFLHFSMSFRLLDTQSFHQPAVLLSSNAERLVLAARPLKPALFKPLVEQEKTVAFPVESFDPVGSSSAEQEQAVLVDFIAILQHDDLCQSIDATAQVSVTAGDVVVFDI